MAVRTLRWDPLEEAGEGQAQESASEKVLDL